jgi:hypothetical protein
MSDCEFRTGRQRPRGKASPSRRFSLHQMTHGKTKFANLLNYFRKLRCFHQSAHERNYGNIINYNQLLHFCGSRHNLLPSVCSPGAPSRRARGHYETQGPRSRGRSRRHTTARGPDCFESSLCTLPDDASTNPGGTPGDGSKTVRPGQGVGAPRHRLMTKARPKPN